MRFPALLFFVIFFPCFTLFGQRVYTPPINFGIIPPDDLSMKVYERDTSAEAVVLCDYETVDITIDGRVMVRKKRHRRIKILNKKGFSYGDVSIPYYSHKKSEGFFFDEACIFLPDGSKTSLTKNDVFIEKVNKWWSSANFTFPKMQEGCVIEYSYFITSDRYYEPEDWFFQEGIPVRYSEIRMDSPAILDYSYFFQGNEAMALTKDEKDLKVFEGINGICTIKPGHFVFENAPAMQPESYITTMNDYRARIRFQLSAIRYLDGRVEKVTDTWENFKKELETSEYFGHHYLKKSYFKEITQPLSAALQELSTQYEKAVFAYNYITERISWNGRYSISGGAEKLKKLYEKGQGNSAQVNLMLLVLLREAGIEANPVLTSTRSHGKMYEESPIQDQFNHMLIYADIDGKPYFLDATNPLRPIGYPDGEALNSRGWHLEKGWMDIKAPGSSVDAFFVDLSLSEEGSLSGNLMGAYSGYNAIPERAHYINGPEGKHWTKRLEQKYVDVKVDEVKSGEAKTIGKVFKDTVDFTIGQAAMVAGDLMYFSPVVYSAFTESPFKAKERYYPVDFPYSIREQHSISVKLPDGYVVEELPESVRIYLPNKGGSFLYAVQEKELGHLNVNINLSIKQLKFYPEEYISVKELFDLFVEKLGEQIVLKKVE